MQSRVNDEYYEDRIREIISDNLRGPSLPSPAPLLKFLYLGGQRHAESLRLLRKLGIDHVLNCAAFRGPNDDPHKSPYEGLDVDYHEFSAEDHEFYDISIHFADAFAYINKVSSNGGIVLVHCAMGINRSAATCVAYLIAHKNMRLLEALKYVKSRTRVILSNPGFRKQLIWFARQKGMLDRVDPKLLNKAKEIESLEKTVTKYNKEIPDDNSRKMIRRPPSGRISRELPRSSLHNVARPNEYIVFPHRSNESNKENLNFGHQYPNKNSSNVMLAHIKPYESTSIRSNERQSRPERKTSQLISSRPLSLSRTENVSNDSNLIQSSRYSSPYESLSISSNERQSRPVRKELQQVRTRPLSLSRVENLSNDSNLITSSTYSSPRNSPSAYARSYLSGTAKEIDSRLRATEYIPLTYQRSNSGSRYESRPQPCERSNSWNQLTSSGSKSDLEKWGSSSSLRSQAAEISNAKNKLALCDANLRKWGSQSSLSSQPLNISESRIKPTSYGSDSDLKKWGSYSSLSDVQKPALTLPKSIRLNNYESSENRCKPFNRRSASSSRL